MAKNIIVTGGNGSMGRQIIRDLSKSEYNIALTYHNNPNEAQEVLEEVRANSPKSFIHKTDVASAKSVELLASRVHEEFGNVYALINCAGVSPSSDRIEDIEEPVWDSIFDINVKGTYLACKYILPFIKSNGAGRIINISSIHGKNAPALRTAYGASKHAIIGLTQALSKEVARNDITVNALCPGPIESEMLTDIWKISASKIGITYEEFAAAKLAEIPLGRLCRPEDISHYVSFLLGEDASFITGAAIDITGGAI